MKVAGLFFKMPFNDTVWSCLNFEQPILAIVLAFASRPPWKLSSVTFVHKCTKDLQTLWKEDFEVGSSILC